MRLSKVKILGGLAVTVVVAALALTSRTDCRAVAGLKEIAIDVSRLVPGSAQLFCYTDDAGRRLRFVLARGGDGQVRSVFDACRQCFSYHRGYQLIGNELVCRVCGNHYKIDQMEAGKASCVPEKLAHRASGDAVTIRTADLNARGNLF